MNDEIEQLRREIRELSGLDAEQEEREEEPGNRGSNPGIEDASRAEPSLSRAARYDSVDWERPETAEADGRNWVSTWKKRKKLLEEKPEVVIRTPEGVKLDLSTWFGRRKLIGWARRRHRRPSREQTAYPPIRSLRIIQEPPLLRYEKQVARNRVIALCVFCLLIIWGVSVFLAR